ncbi:helix-turn-helix domain-containing protein [Methylocystis parvus]|uniref:Helix-turn-helix transcriptional regulator n=1 Tax=Methylocystis parvus TaxID=134 RepID=A0A6B8M919_9HYPH|nr:AraC family transcriptional regulator [Methylocystis parvus]QGM98372.1 helix-turn-helix transcriptional regulator [Methylocystis parvus]WBK01297.1 AraC family transcriptional regulator [Methylocystis parvus OBBP]
MRRFSKSRVLPPLAFGEDRAIHAADPYQAAAAARVLGGVEVYEPAFTEAPFQHKIATLSFNGLELNAAASSPMRLGIRTPKQCYLLMPFYGDTALQIGARQYQWGAAGRALLLSDCFYRFGTAQTRSVLIARIDSDRLKNTISRMLGETNSEERNLGDEEVQILDLQTGSMNFMSVFRHLCAYINSPGVSRIFLEKIGLDDWFYRQLACWLKPEIVHGGEPDHFRERSTAGTIDAVCDAIRNSLDRPLTKSEMEEIGGLSARGLQYAFQRKFGCSPMEWQRRERLYVARERLSREAENIGVLELSLDLGFSSPSRFAAYYKGLFGESPKETKTRRRRPA